MEPTRYRQRTPTPRVNVGFRTSRRDEVDRLVSAGVFLSRAHFYETAEAELLSRYPQIAFRVDPKEATTDAAD